MHWQCTKFEFNVGSVSLDLLGNHDAKISYQLNTFTLYYIIICPFDRLIIEHYHFFYHSPLIFVFLLGWEGRQ
jgi:hypothetical protein